jgi:hypothetical protein
MFLIFFVVKFLSGFLQYKLRHEVPLVAEEITTFFAKIFVTTNERIPAHSKHKIINALY